MAERKKPHVHPVDEVWLALGDEDALEPRIDIVDSHIHLWDFSTPPYFADAYRNDAVSCDISASIFVDCTMGYKTEGAEAFAPVGEVEFACAQADAAADGDVAVAAAIIGWADLTLGENVCDVLDALEVAGGGRFRGVRTRATYDPDPLAGYGDNGIGPAFLQRDDYRRGVEQLGRRGHVLDIYAFHTQLSEVADLARAFPDIPIILNHIGGPLGIGVYANMREKVYADWVQGMAEVARCPNVSVKIGGFAISRIAIVPAGKRAMPFSSAEVADFCAPWVHQCLSLFGANRCLFGSNFPVDKVALPLGTLVNAMKLLTADLSSADQTQFFADNARRIYRI